MKRHMASRLITAVLLVAALCAGCALAGCGNSSQQTGAVKVKDDAGNTVVLDKPAARVVSIAPSNTEIVYALGAQDKLVGVTKFCDYPKAAQKKEKVGDFDNPNVEKIVSLKPQLVLATGGIQQGLVDSLDKFGIKVAVVEPTTINGLFDDIVKVGTLLGVKEKAEGVTAGLKERVDKVKAAVADLPGKKVFFEIYNEPLMTAGSDSIITEMIEDAGGKSLGEAAGKGFPQYSVESLVKENPDVYFAIKGAMQDPKDIKGRPMYSSLKAVKDGKVFVVDDNLFVRTGPRIVDGLEILAKDIHPEAFEKTGQGQ